MVLPAAASVPAPGSVSAKAPRISPAASLVPYFSFWAVLPNSKIGQVANDVWPDTMMDVLAHTLASSSRAIT